MKHNELYPLCFTSYYKPVIWGGHKLKEQFNRSTPNGALPIGEAWEICDRDDFVSQVTNGPLQGVSLRELLQKFGQDLVGSAFQGGRFPLLVKIIDAEQRISLQVHPNEKAATQIGGTAEPKAEIWYIMDSAPGAQIIIGLQPGVCAEHLASRLHSPEIEQELNIFTAQPGDVYFIQAGQVHAIGGGNLLLEVQQNSDTTYRLSDWGRIGTDGISRELHIRQAMRCIDFSATGIPLIRENDRENTINKMLPINQNCSFSQIAELYLTQDYTDTTAPGRSFHLLTAAQGGFEVRYANVTTTILPGGSGLIPACCGTYTLHPTTREAKVIRTTL